MPIFIDGKIREVKLATSIIPPLNAKLTSSHQSGNFLNITAKNRT
ncbi:hypothetical protein [Venenivibrio stagnispumantis]